MKTGKEGQLCITITVSFLIRPTNKCCYLTFFINRSDGIIIKINK
jgi:hypothetical protein